MNLIDRTYFKGIIRLPYLERTTGVGKVTQVAGEVILEEFVEEYQPGYLKDVLGMSLYNAFMQGLRAPEPLQIWLDLREAITHETTDKQSPVAYHVYPFVMEAATTKTTSTGEKVAHASSTTPASHDYRVQRASVQLQRLTGELQRWIDERWEVYGPYSDAAGCRVKKESGITNIYGI
jgi:hypothetical protein